VIAPGSRTLNDYEAHWRAFCVWLEKHYPKKNDKGEKVSMELREVTPDQAQRYLAEIEATRSPNTRNKVLSSRCSGWCSRCWP